MGSNAALSHLVHSLCANLNLHPLVLRAFYRDVQTLISIRLRHGKPIAHALWVRGVHVGDDGECLPALLFFFLGRTVDNDSDGKEVVNAFKGAFLLLHLLPYRMDGLGTALHVEFQSSCRQLLANRGDEMLNIGITGSLGGIQLFLDVIVSVVLHVLEREVFQLALQLVES